MAEEQNNKMTRPLEHQSIPETGENKRGSVNFWTDKTILKWSAALFCTLSGVIIFFFLLFSMRSVIGYLGAVVDSLTAIISGCIIAYVLNPLMKMYERWMQFGVEKLRKKSIDEKGKKSIRFTAIIFSEVTMIIIFIILVMMLVPELLRNLIGTINQVSEQLDQIPGWIDSLQDDEIFKDPMVEQVLEKGISWLNGWISGDLLSTINIASQKLMKGAVGIVGFLFDFVIGIIVSIYILSSKEHFCGIAKKLVYGFMRPNYANEVLDICRKTDRIFGGFIMGKILDSAIIGVLCYICLLILRMPYALIVSVIIGVTNVIPFFGPFIGAVPCAILILLADPIKAIIFVVFILILQQVDGNIIGPKILGDSTGLNSFWIIFAILFAGGMFGVVGMVIGAPTFALFYYLLKRLVERNLRRKNLPIDSDAYINLERVGLDQEEMVYKED